MVQSYGITFCFKLIKYMYWSTRTAITKHHRLGCLKQQKFISHSSGTWKSKIKVPARLFFVMPLSWAPESHLLAMSSHGLCSVCDTPRVSSSSYKESSLIGSGPTFTTSFNLNYLLKVHISK